MGKGFDTFMENDYWRGIYESAPSDNLREYYRIMFETSSFIFGDDTDEELEKQLETIELNKEDIRYLLENAGMIQAKIHYQKNLRLLEGGNENKTIPASAFKAEIRNPWYDPKLQRASELAREQFAGRTDKAGVDYFSGHLCSVAELVETNEERIVAFLHDILEDTDYPEDKLREEFGDKIVDAILLMTHKEHLDEEEYLDYIRKLKEAGNELAIAVKIADLTNNSDFTRLGVSSPEELPEKDRKRWEKYQESLEILRG